MMSVYVCLLRVKGFENRQEEKSRGSKSVPFGNPIAMVSVTIGDTVRVRTSE